MTATATDVVDRTPAGYQELKGACPGAGAVFLCSQLDRGSTIEDARAAWEIEKKRRDEAFFGSAGRDANKLVNDRLQQEALERARLAHCRYGGLQRVRSEAAAAENELLSAQQSAREEIDKERVAIAAAEKKFEFDQSSESSRALGEARRAHQEAAHRRRMKLTELSDRRTALANALKRAEEAADELRLIAKEFREWFDFAPGQVPSLKAAFREAPPQPEPPQMRPRTEIRPSFVGQVK